MNDTRGARAVFGKEQSAQSPLRAFESGKESFFVALLVQGLAPNNEYRFLYVEEHHNVELPHKRLLKRERQLDWLAFAEQQAMAIAV
ncbi:MAG: hypothetical protein HY308_00290 [Gammaproteobacteria bacterium]|nr:hypothetical protein [Gammaproteobacteria bacterium]